jgi:hypothetical protein
MVNREPIEFNLSSAIIFRAHELMTKTGPRGKLFGQGGFDDEKEG